MEIVDEQVWIEVKMGIFFICDVGLLSDIYWIDDCDDFLWVICVGCYIVCFKCYICNYVVEVDLENFVVEVDCQV